MNVASTFQPIYLPRWVRVAAIALGVLIIAPPIVHMFAHTVLMFRGIELHETGSDWPRVALIVLGAGVGFPDPVVRMIAAWRGRKSGKTDEHRTGGGE